jgi:Domain of unknown function (DUF4476)
MSFQDSGRAPRSADRTTTTLRLLFGDLVELRRLASQVSDRRLRDDLERRLTDAESHAQALEREGNRRPSDAARERESERNDSEAMERQSFDALLRSVERASFDSERLSRVRTAAQTNSLQCSQAKRLLKAFQFDADRRRAAVLLHPRLTDPRNFGQLAETFSWSAEWRSLCRELGVNS